MWSIVSLVALIVLLAVGYTIWGMRKIGRPTTGPKIDLSQRTGTALIVIDMQRDFTEMTGPKSWEPEEAQRVIDGINHRAEFAHKSGWQVVTIRQVYEGAYTNFLVRLLGGGLGAKGSDGLGLDSRVSVNADADFVKPMSDSFSCKALEAYLQENRIGHLELVGLNGVYCVKNTAYGALNRGYKVTLNTEAILASSEEGWVKEKENLANRGGILTAASGSPL
ncbi:MAG: cysteine hydrolase [Proteobacteria bacterium]|nr:cysteine hydrolase [Pseudomonadota bacterium]